MYDKPKKGATRGLMSAESSPRAIQTIADMGTMDAYYADILAQNKGFYLRRKGKGKGK